MMAYNSFMTVLPLAARMLFEEDIDIEFKDKDKKNILVWYILLIITNH